MRKIFKITERQRRQLEEEDNPLVVQASKKPTETTAQSVQNTVDQLRNGGFNTDTNDFNVSVQNETKYYSIKQLRKKKLSENSNLYTVKSFVKKFNRK